MEQPALPISGKFKTDNDDLEPDEHVQIIESFEKEVDIKDSEEEPKNQSGGIL